MLDQYVKDIQIGHAQLGFTGYYRGFIPRYNSFDQQDEQYEESGEICLD